MSQRAVGGLAEEDKQRDASIEEMPTWPVDAHIRRRFGLANIALLLPALAQALGASASTQAVLNQVGRILTG